VRTWIEGWRIPMDAKDAMLSQCLLQAVIDTNDALKPARALAIADDLDSLEAWIYANAPDETLNDISVLETLYLSAVGNLGKAKTIRRLQAQIRKPQAETETQASENTEGYFLDEYFFQ
jgi:hypothetical protein